MTDQQPALALGSSPGVAQGLGGGLLLRQARLAAGLHIASLAIAIKVPVKKLEALEAERFDLLTDAVFVRALAASICRNLKIDPQPILEKLPRNPLQSLRPVETLIQAPYQASFQASNQGRNSSPHLSRPVLGLVLVLLLAAGLLAYFLPDLSELQDHPVFAKQLTNPAGTEVVAPVVVVESIPVISNSDPVDPIPASMIAVAPPAPASKVLEGTLIFKQQGIAWLQVNDGRGQSLLNRNASSGETVSVTGVLPLSVVVGRANVTEVLVMGKPFNLSAVSQGNVARFEVK